MQEKLKMILQEDGNFVHIKQQYSDSFCEKIDSKSAFFPADMANLMTDIHDFNEDQISRNSLSWYSIAKICSTPGRLNDSNMPLEYFFL